MPAPRRPSLWLLVLCVCAVAIAPQISAAQNDYLELYARYARSRSYGSAVVLPSIDGPIALFTVRVPNNRLVFMRNSEPLAGETFRAQVEVSVQIRQGDRLVAEKSWQTPHSASTYEISVSRDHDLEATLPVRLEPGSYVYRLVVRDVNAGETFRPSTPARVVVPDFDNASVATAAVIEGTIEAGAIRLANLGGDAPHAGQSALMVPVVPGDDAEPDAAIEYTIWHLDERLRPERRRQSPSRSATDPDADWDALPSDVDLTRAVEVASGLIPRSEWIPYDLSVPNEPTTGAAILRGEPLEGAYLGQIPLDEGLDRAASYAIEVALNGEAGTRRTTAFAFHWRDMPISLYDAETAIRMLSFIESSARIKQMLRGTREDREQALTAFWEQRDPTPDTPLNELMAEYYRRIDHAAMEYRSGGGSLPNGLRTDQARIYIVHGPPANVERTFPPLGGVEEIWTYQGGRRFVFRAANSLEPLALQETE